MGKPALKEMGMLLIFVAALVGLSSAGTCPATATAAVCVDGCRPAGVACSETTDTAGFRVMTLTGTQDWSGVTAEYENVLIRIVLTGQQTATFGATTSLSFNVPLTTQFGAAFNLIFVDGVATGSGTGTVVSLGGTINLRVGRIVPESVPLFRFPNADANGANWRGLFGAVTNTNPDQCLVTTSTPVYTSNTVAVTLGVRQNPAPTNGVTCATFSEGGLSGGAIAGIVIGSIIGAALLVLLAIFLFRKLDFDSKRQLFSRTKIHAAESSVPM